VTRFVIEQAERAGLASVFSDCAITKNSKAPNSPEMGEMKDAGIVAVSDDGRPGAHGRNDAPRHGICARVRFARDRSLRRQIARSRRSHARRSLVAGAGSAGMPAAAEEVDAERNCLLAELTGARVHLAHVSTRGAIEAVRRAKEKGLPVTCEAAPHHWTLTDSAAQDYDTNTKMSPPLRSQDHVYAVHEGLRDGTIDIVATDHAPHHADEKALEYDQAPFGIVGLETAVGLAFDRLVNQGVISLERLVALCSTIRPGFSVLGDRGSLHPGSRADLTILDPELAWTFDVARSKSKSRNTPFDGYSFRGATVATLVAGRIAYLHSAYGHVVQAQRSGILVN